MTQAAGPGSVSGARRDPAGAVETLLRRASRRIEVGPTSYTVTAPCLLTQLHAAVEASSRGHGGRSAPGSRLPVDAGALDLWFAILATTAAWAAVLRVDRKRYQLHAEAHPDGPPAVGLVLRAVAAAAVSQPNRQAVADRVADSAHRWRHQIEAMLTPSEFAGRGLRGVPCPHCGATWAVDADDDNPLPVAQRLRTPALRVEFGETGVIRWLRCVVCLDFVGRDTLTEWAEQPRAA